MNGIIPLIRDAMHLMLKENPTEQEKKLAFWLWLAVKGLALSCVYLPIGCLIWLIK